MFVQKNKKILFLGTPKIAAEMLSALIENGANVVGAVTQPDRQKDRKQNLIPTPVKEVALANNLPVFQPVKVREIREQITEIKPDLVIVCAYGEIVGEWLLKLPKYKCVNIHVSLLPKLRGAAPINYAIFEDLKETGVTLMYMNKGMDTGDIIKQKAIPVAPTETFSSLYDKLTNLGKELIVEMFDELFDENLPHFQQDNELATYCSKIVEEKISWDLPAKQIECFVRGLAETPYAYAILEDMRIKFCEVLLATYEPKEPTIPGTILQVSKAGIVVACGQNTYLCITKILMPGKKPLLVSQIINGNHNFIVGKKFN